MLAITQWFVNLYLYKLCLTIYSVKATIYNFSGNLLIRSTYQGWYWSIIVCDLSNIRVVKYNNILNIDIGTKT